MHLYFFLYILHCVMSYSSACLVLCFDRVCLLLILVLMGCLKCDIGDIAMLHYISLNLDAKNC